ncbi:hypothetical protein H8356DRAFT_1421995 [Neocallimastix lanati (nom. inval.)]|nr:hypothetical protein H8356DRAFT_1421995 [Neocallimastix sp. JGI-2020a]
MNLSIYYRIIGGSCYFNNFGKNYYMIFIHDLKDWLVKQFYNEINLNTKSQFDHLYYIENWLKILFLKLFISQKYNFFSSYHSSSSVFFNLCVNWNTKNAPLKSLKNARLGASLELEKLINSPNKNITQAMVLRFITASACFFFTWCF